MHKKIIIAAVVLALLVGAAYITTQSRLFKKSPNIIIILTDDMDMALMPFMEKTNQLIGEQGATFTNFFVTTPACCPSRSSILRGQYAHNTDILENSPGFARFFKLQREENALPVWLNRAGYQTALFGKYLNNYPINAGRNYVPPGWTEWGAFFAMQPTHFYYDYTMNENGTLVDYGDSPEEYSTDVILDKSLRFIDRNAADGSPFLLFISVYAPHGPGLPAPRHQALFHDLTYPQSPSFNEEDMSDKPEIIRALTETNEVFDEYDANAYFQARARSLQAVDEMVEEIIRTLERSGQLEDTYIIFTSDNGFHLGEHRIPSGKGTPYEEDIRVPFLIRGPDIQPGMQVTQIAANIDIAPTIADIVSVKTPDFVDGRSLLPFLLGKDADWRKGLLIEFGYVRAEQWSVDMYPVSFSNEAAGASIFPDPESDTLLAGIGGGGFRGVRTETFVYVEYENGESEYYDLIADPYQLENTVRLLDEQTLEALRLWVRQLYDCEARACRTIEQTPPVNLVK